MKRLFVGFETTALLEKEARRILVASLILMSLILAVAPAWAEREPKCTSQAGPRVLDGN